MAFRALEARLSSLSTVITLTSWGFHFITSALKLGNFSLIKTANAKYFQSCVLVIKKDITIFQIFVFYSHKSLLEQGILM